MPSGSGVREKTTLKSVSGQASCASHPTTAFRSPLRRTSASWLGQYTVFRGCFPSRVTTTDTVSSGAELNFSVLRGYTYSTSPASDFSSSV